MLVELAKFLNRPLLLLLLLDSIRLVKKTCYVFMAEIYEKSKNETFLFLTYLFFEVELLFDDVDVSFDDDDWIGVGPS